MIGVYVLYRGNRCIYVGASTFVERRLREHPLKGKYTSFRLHPCEAENLRPEEQRLIDELKPTLNKAIPTTIRATTKPLTYNYSFRLSDEKIGKLEKIGAEHDRDRTYMVDKAIDFYLKAHAENGTKPTPAKKKAGAR